MSQSSDTDPFSALIVAALADSAKDCDAEFGGIGDTKPFLPDPIAQAAAMMVDSAVLGHVGLMESATARGAIVVLVVPRGWHDEVASCWRQRVLGHDIRDPEVSGIIVDRDRHCPAVIIYDGPPGDEVRRLDLVRRALVLRLGVLAVTADPALVERELRAVVDATVIIGAPTAKALMLVAREVFPGEVGNVEPEVAGLVQPTHLVDAIAGRRSAQAYLQRISKLVRSTEASKAAAVAKPPRWTLDNLPLPPTVLKWGRQLQSDIAAYRAGEIEWSDVDRGALVWGPSGTGKTTFAVALAASCGVPLVLGGLKVWEAGPDGKSDYKTIVPNLVKTFRAAKAAAPSIIFIDEIDTFAARGSGGHNESYNRHLLNALLEELDGSDDRDGVVVIAATNRPGDLDQALRRPGRLGDAELEMGLPDRDMLARIMAGHLGLPAAYLRHAATLATGGSGADCERWCRGARRAARYAKRPVSVADLVAEIQSGASTMDPARRHRIAVHECGHALVAVLAKPGSVVSASLRVGVAGIGSVGGVELRAGDALDTAADVDVHLRYLLGGRAAEEIILGAPSTGAGGPAHSDLAQATTIAAASVASWGLGGRLTWLGDPKGGGLPGLLIAHPDVAAAVEQRLTAALAGARAVLEKHLGALMALVDALLEAETMTGEEVERIVLGVRAPAGWSCVG